MSYPDDNIPAKAYTAQPIPVKVEGFDKLYVKRPRNTVAQTYVLDPAGINGPTKIQLCAEEPTRYRLTVKPWTAAITVLGQPPRNSPDTASPTVAPEGGYITANDGANPWEFFGTDPLWINSLGTITLVTVVKEYL